MRTTIELPDPLFQQAKVVAAQRGVTLKELFTQALAQALQADAPTSKRMLHAPIGKSGEHFIPVRTNSELATLLEDAASHGAP